MGACGYTGNKSGEMNNFPVVLYWKNMGVA